MKVFQRVKVLFKTDYSDNLKIIDTERELNAEVSRVLCLSFWSWSSCAYTLDQTMTTAPAGSSSTSTQRVGVQRGLSGATNNVIRSPGITEQKVWLFSYICRRSLAKSAKISSKSSRRSLPGRRTFCRNIKLFLILKWIKVAGHLRLFDLISIILSTIDFLTFRPTEKATVTYIVYRDYVSYILSEAFK